MSVPSHNRRPTARPASSVARWIALAAALFAALAALLVSSVGPGPVAAASPAEESPTPTLATGTGAFVGMAWIDADTDGVQDPGEAPLPEARIEAESIETGAKVSTTTGADGKYRLANLPPAVYRVVGSPPPGYALTTQASYDVAMAAGAIVTLNFGAWMPPTPTPSPTPIPALDPTGAEQVFCGGVYSGDTSEAKNNVTTYSCVPWWDESGNEKVYRLELSSTQPVTVTLLDASVDLDLFLLRYVSPASCVAAGDNYLKYDTLAGVYFLAVDGYKGANGSYRFRVDCPVDAAATPTPTFTPSVTPTATATLPVTATPSPTSPVARIYLPTVLRNAAQGATGPTVTLVLQDGLYGYSGTSDTTLDSWLPSQPSGSDNRLRLFYSRPPSIVTQKSPVIKFDLSLLPAGAEVRSATLRLYAPAAPAHDVRAQAHGLLRAWDEASASWIEAVVGQPWAAPGASAVAVDRTLWASEPAHIVEGARWYELDIAPLAQQWAQQPNSNHGVVLTSLAGDSAANVEARFASRESGLISRPQLVISFVLPIAAP